MNEYICHQQYVENNNNNSITMNIIIRRVFAENEDEAIGKFIRNH